MPRGMEGWRAGVVRLTVAMLVVAVFGASTVMTSPEPVAAQTTGSSELQITVDPDEAHVLVEETIHPDGSNRAVVWVPNDAIAIDVDADIVAQTDSGQFTMLELAGELDGAVVSYTMPSTKGRAAQGTRVNGAMVGFHLWPNFDSVSVSIELPPGFVANVGPLFRPALIGDETLAYRVEHVPAEQVLGFWFVAFRDAGLVSQTVDIGDSEVEVAGWGDDPEWSEQAVRYVSEGVPALADLIGQPWPAKELRVVESVAPAQEGYGGWFDLWEVEIAIPDSLDGEVMLHELAHVWFNNRWFQERWMIEGFAEEYANLALLELDGTEIEPVEPGPAPPGISGLNDWRRRFFFEDTWDIEYYGYDTSYWVLDQLRREIGVDGMAATIEGLVVLPHPYAVSTDSRAAGTNDWRRFLDSLERQGGSTGAESLFLQYVVTPEQIPLIATRRQTLDRYDAFAEGRPSGVPEVIRIALAEWQFDAAESLLDEAEQLKADLADLDERAQALGLELPTYLDSLYTSSEANFDLVEEAITETSGILAAFEADPDRLTDANRRNFGLGRYERLDVDASVGAAPGLNQDRDPGPPFGLYLTLIGVLAVLLLVAFVVLARILVAAEPPAPDEATSKEPIPPDPDEEATVQAPTGSLIGRGEPAGWGRRPDGS